MNPSNTSNSSRTSTASDTNEILKNMSASQHAPSNRHSGSSSDEREISNPLFGKGKELARILTRQRLKHSLSSPPFPGALLPNFVKVDGAFYNEYKKRGFTSLMTANTDHIATNENEVSVSKGQYILLNDKNTDKKIIKVLLEDGKTEGWIPIEKVTVVEPMKQKNDVDTTSLIRNKRQTSTTLEALLLNRPSADKVSEIVKEKPGSRLFGTFRTRPKQEDLAVNISKDMITFNDQPFVPTDVKTDTFEIANLSSQKLKFEILFDPDPNVLLQVSPAKGQLGKGHIQHVKVSASNVKKSVEIYLSVSVAGFMMANLLVRVRKGGIFGVDPANLSYILDEGFRVPRCLVQLKTALQKNKGYVREGVFRMSGNVEAVKEITKQLELNTFQESNDSLSTAQVLKNWFRDLPTPVLQSIDEDIVPVHTNKAASFASIHSMDEPDRSITFWLLKFFQDLLKFPENKLSVSSLAILWAPILSNLDQIDDDKDVLQHNHKVTKFLHNVIEVQLQPLQPPPLPTHPKPLVMPKPIRKKKISNPNLTLLTKTNA